MEQLAHQMNMAQKHYYLAAHEKPIDLVVSSVSE